MHHSRSKAYVVNTFPVNINFQLLNCPHVFLNDNHVQILTNPEEFTTSTESNVLQLDRTHEIGALPDSAAVVPELRGCWWHHIPWVIFHAGDTQASFQQNLNVLCALIILLSLGKFWWNHDYPILMHLYNNYSQILNPLAFLCLWNSQINMITVVHRNLSGVSIMANQGRIILQNFCVCNLSIGFDMLPHFKSCSFQ